MKHFYLLVCIALVTITQAQAQTPHDTIYMWKNGVAKLKHSIKEADLDSITYIRPKIISLPVTVKIGTQEWIPRNLDVSTYSDGTPIPEFTDFNDWSTTETGAWISIKNFYDDNNIENLDQSLYDMYDILPLYGKLYNWYAVKGIHDTDPSTPNKQLAPPIGSHIANEKDFIELENYFNNKEIYLPYFGIALGARLGWEYPSVKFNNFTGFWAFPVGFLDYASHITYTQICCDGGNYSGMSTQWWAPSDINDYGDYSNSYGIDKRGSFAQGAFDKRSFLSVRCVVDKGLGAIAPPTVTTTTVSSIGTTIASSGGTISSDVRSLVTALGLVWSTATNPTIDLSTKTLDGTRAGLFTSVLSGLLAGTTYYVRAYATNSAGTAYGNELSFTTNTATTTDLPPTVTIGSQRWTTRNLDVTTYNDGSVIPQVTDPTQWANLTTGAWCYYDNDPAKGAVYGKLYNWYAVAGIHDTDPNTPNKVLAPIGYHVPSDAEWTTLTTFLGGENVAGGKMKSSGTSLWNTPNAEATNSSGFTGHPGGIRISNGAIFNIGYLGYWWSSSETNTPNAWGRVLDYYNGSALSYRDDKVYGFSVRFLRD